MKLVKVWISFIAVLLVGAALLSGCGGGGGGGTVAGNSNGATVPASPVLTDSGITAGDTQNTIAWSTVSGATSYNIYYGTSPSLTTTSGTALNNVQTPYLHLGLTNGVTYYYIVTAVNSAGESAPSAVKNGTPVHGFTATGPLGSARMFQSSVLLQSGKALVFGGFNNSSASLSSAELYDPATGRFTATGSMATNRYFFATTALADGTVLLTGGLQDTVDGSNTLDTGEIYDPSTGRFTLLTDTMNAGGRYNHTATLLPNGTVLIVGGTLDDGSTVATTATAEIFDPVAKTFTLVGSLGIPREGHTATLLGNGKVLISGGANALGTAVASAELYDPATQQFQATGSLHTPRTEQTAILLSSTTVLILGGGDDANNLLGSAEIYDVSAGTFSQVAASMTTLRDFFTATLLPSGKVLIAGGEADSATLNTAELFDPAAGTFSALSAVMHVAHEGHTATLLANGTVLLAGGGGSLNASQNPVAITGADLF